MDLKAQRQSLVRPHLALTKPGAVRLGPWMWERPLRDSTSLISLHVPLAAPRQRKPCCYRMDEAPQRQRATGCRTTTNISY